MSFILSIDHYQSVKSSLKDLGLLFRSEYFLPRNVVQPPMPLWSIYSTRGKPLLAPAEWGMLPNWDSKNKITRPLTIARIETLYERVSYKNLITRYRALIPVNKFTVRSDSRSISDTYSFYEVIDKNQKCMMLAALYQFNVDGNMQIVLLSRKQKASGQHRSVRMPLILDKANWGDWLNAEKKTKIFTLLSRTNNDSLEFSEL